MTLFKDILWMLRDRWYQLKDTRKNYRTHEAGQAVFWYIGVAVVVVLVLSLLFGWPVRLR
jgi:hypothetical protein